MDYAIYGFRMNILVAIFWTHPIEKYAPWFKDDIGKLADFIGVEESAFIEMICSEDPRERAIAYEAIGDYFGYDNLDSDPMVMKQAEMKKRYKDRKSLTLIENTKEE